MAKQLTPKKQRFLDFIRSFSGDHDRAPTFHEIMEGLKIKSLGTVNWYVKELEKIGVLERGKYNAKRALSLLDQSTGNELPLLGLIAAGYPLEAVENRETIEVPISYIHPDNYVLKVKGDSMIDDHIEDGDYVIVRQKAEASQGQTVVAFVNNEATLKRYYLKPNGVELHPRNPDYDVIRVSAEDEFRIGGVVLAILRQYE
ncbi:transcriptional repressor LexA [bacterium]|nr:transcriptional repressor LexA [bacterium]MBU1633343.1 transcriptional repressor LexA [bacterium]MBU1872683.1 transcriptional repressor LexA [bacterium]